MTNNNNNEAASTLADLLILAQRTNKRTTALSTNNLQILDQLISELQNTTNVLQSDVTPKEALMKLHQRLVVMKPISTVANNNKEIYSKLSRFGKEIDKSFPEEDVPITNPFSKLDYSNLTQAITEYYLKQKNVQAAKVILPDYKNTDLFQQGICLYEQTLKGNYQAGIEWAQNEKLYETYGIMIEFELKQRQFLRMARNKQIHQATTYAKLHFSKFLDRQLQQIQHMMGFLFFADTSDRYQQYLKLDDNTLAQQLLKVHYEVNEQRISQMNPLDICLKVGMEVEPQFKSHIKSILDNRQKQTLPTNIVLKKDYKCHSLFVCPVVREISHQTPVVLKCGHAISEFSFNRIVQNRTKHKFKCPVCHTEQRLTDVIQMHY